MEEVVDSFHVTSRLLKEGRFVVAVMLQMRGIVDSANVSIFSLHIRRVCDRLVEVQADSHHIKVLLDTDGLRVREQASQQFGESMRQLIETFASVEHVVKTGLPSQIEDTEAA